MKKSLFHSVSIGGMTAAERAKGRYMRAPDHVAGDANTDFAAFEAAGEVEVGKPAIESNQEETEKPAKISKPPHTAKPTQDAPEKESVDEQEDEETADSEDDQDDEGKDEQSKRKHKASDRIRDLSKRLRNSERLRLADQTRLDALEKRLLPGGSDGGNSVLDIGKAPDPSDTDTYPLGHLDDRYIEDKLEWLATKKAAERADAGLQRQQENEQRQQAEKAYESLLDKVDDISTRGSEQFEDFQETVVEAGMRGAWRLDQPTFESACEADNGAQILYELSQDKKEAKRVAELSPFQQMKFVMERDAEIGKGKQTRKIPGAGAPPATQTRGANSRTRISPTTDNLDDFEKAWAADAKGK